jgi:Ser-tRNA(Ala) deacylase AlaX
MTRKRFWTEPYLTELQTRVATVDGAAVTVEETIFYAESGGQESDAGTIGGRAVARAEKRGREIVYTLADGHGLAAGDAVRIEIDWTRRHRLMRLHLAAELVLELVYRALAGVEKTGAHISADKARIDFAWPESIAPLVPALAADANALVAADHPIVSAFSDEDNERRYWEIAGFARVPCGGTHLRRTGEIGAIALKRDNRGKGQQRIVITLR